MLLHAIRVYKSHGESFTWSHEIFRRARKVLELYFNSSIAYFHFQQKQIITIQKESDIHNIQLFLDNNITHLHHLNYKTKDVCKYAKI